MDYLSWSLTGIDLDGSSKLSPGVHEFARHLKSVRQIDSSWQMERILHQNSLIISSTKEKEKL